MEIIVDTIKQEISCSIGSYNFTTPPSEDIDEPRNKGIVVDV